MQVLCILLFHILKIGVIGEHELASNWAISIMPPDSTKPEAAQDRAISFDPPAESAGAVLAKNLVVARVVAGVTQHALAAAAGVSRATIAQLETGCSDPRLSTIVLLARALGIPAIVLLMGKPETIALTALLENPSPPISLSEGDVAHMRRLLDTGMLRDRIRAAVVGADLARRAADAATESQVVAAIFSAIHPGPGTIAGTLLGRMLNNNGTK
jgi:DNA-binding XRE family transcriptional regulator